MSIERPVMIFDGECRFCRRWIARWRRRTKDRVTYLPFQALGTRHAQISRAACQDAVQFLYPDGRVYAGADAIVRLFEFGLPGGRAARFICGTPPVIWILRLGYAWVSKNRRIISQLSARRRRARTRVSR